MEGIILSIKLAFLFALMGFALCLAPFGIEAKHRRHFHHHHHHHPQRHHCGPTPSPPPPIVLIEPPPLPPSMPPPPAPSEAQPPAPDSGVAYPLPPGYELTPYQVHGCGYQCIDSNDCDWPCMACCANSTCCDE